MKVSTDACIQGAWTPVHPDVSRALDIGCGTGLLSLMLAQKSDTLVIDALEIDKEASGQAKENMAASSWINRIHVRNEDARTYVSPAKYDLIICNPPFFSRDLCTPDRTKALAKHQVTLSSEDLLSILENNLTSDGYASILWPVRESEKWKNLLKKRRWGVFRELEVVPGGTKGQANRIISLCRRRNTSRVEKEVLQIRTPEGSYSKDFMKLLKPYYLNF